MRRCLRLYFSALTLACSTNTISLHHHILVSAMPELPEVEGMRLQIERIALHRTITSYEIMEQGGGPRNGLFDDKVIACDPVVLETSLRGAVVIGTGRKGKHMYMELSNGKCLLFHFGMTGSFAIQGEQIPTYKTFSVSSLWPPKFCKFEVVFSDGGRVAYCDPRRLGKIRICEKDLLYEIPPLSQLAIDPVLDDLNYDEIFTKFQQTSIAVKALILDQERVFSGVGNWIADEIMYQCDLHPSTSADRLTYDQVKLLTNKTKEICSIAIECNRREADYPEHWLFHQRWRGKKAGGKMADGSPIQFVTVGGRTSAVVTKRKITQLQLSEELLEVSVEVLASRTKKTKT